MGFIPGMDRVKDPESVTVNDFVSAAKILEGIVIPSNAVRAVKIDNVMKDNVCLSQVS